jgi:hypothetical protein
VPALRADRRNDPVAHVASDARALACKWPLATEIHLQQDNAGGRVMTRELTSEHCRILTILAECPGGATASCLTQLNRGAHAIIAELVGRELVDAQAQYIATRDSNLGAISVVRLKITNAGRRAIAGVQPPRP